MHAVRLALLTLTGLAATAHAAPSDSSSTSESTRAALERMTDSMESAADSPGDHVVVIEKELMITDLSVVDADVPEWSFGSLMASLAGVPVTDPRASSFIKHWLLGFEQAGDVNGDSLPAREGIRRIIDDWKRRDGAAGSPDPDWSPNPSHAPFRLLAIVNRIDLRTPPGETIRHAGEGRFVFCAIDETDAPLQFTVIFEFEQPASDEPSLRSWARAWHALGALEFGPAYNAALTQVTERFAGRGQGAGRQNGSLLRQLRTNDIALASPWELREFRLAPNGHLEPAAVLQSAAIRWNGTPGFAAFVNENQAAILDPRRGPSIPLTFQGEPFLGARAPVTANQLDFHWSASGIDSNDARHLVSLASCNGCHAGETHTRFVHVAPRERGEQARLSLFLNGGAVPDPARPSTTRRFADLMLRARSLQELASSSSDGGLELMRSLSRRELGVVMDAVSGTVLPRRARVH